MRRQLYSQGPTEFSTREFGLGWLLGASVLSADLAHPSRRHSHPYMEIIFCIKGEFVYDLGGERPVTLKSGMGIVIPERTNHPLKSGIAAPGRRIVLHLGREMPPKPQYASFAPHIYSGLRKTLSDGAKRPFRLNKQLNSVVRELSALLLLGRKGVSEPLLAHMRILATDILFRTATTLAEPPSAAEPQMMDEAVRYLDEHLRESASISELVRHIGYSRSRLFELFREHTGLTPHEYLIRLRVRRAEELLRSSDLPVRTIAQQVGFNDYIHFTGVFKRYTGHTASEIRDAEHTK